MFRKLRASRQVAERLPWPTAKSFSSYLSKGVRDTKVGTGLNLYRRFLE